MFKNKERNSKNGYKIKQNKAKVKIKIKKEIKEKVNIKPSRC